MALSRRSHEQIEAFASDGNNEEGAPAALGVELRSSAAGVLRRFSRHPKALAAIEFLQLPASYRFVLQVLVIVADQEGRSWMKPKALAAVCPRSAARPTYSVTQVLKALRGLRALQLIEWDRIKPFGRTPPTRGSAHGRWSQSGQRVYTVQLARLDGKWRPDVRSATIGTESGGSILQDRSGSILQDRSTGSRLPSEDFNKEITPAAPSRGAREPRPLAARVASETPGAPPSAARTARPLAANMASETPSYDAISTASRCDPDEPNVREAAREGRARVEPAVAGPMPPAEDSSLPADLRALLQRGHAAAVRNADRDAPGGLVATGPKDGPGES